jgi:hypothetical protein
MIAARGHEPVLVQLMARAAVPDEKAATVTASDGLSELGAIIALAALYLSELREEPPGDALEVAQDGVALRL